MLGKTHMAVGIAASLLVLQPKNVRELVFGTGAAAIGAVISDIDSGTSESHKDADKIIAMVIASIAILAMSEKIWNIGLYKEILKNSSLTRAVISVLVFLLICSFGKELPHRTFMHSFTALFLLSGCIGVFLPELVPYFSAAFLSHLGIDILNRKGEQLFYPLRRKFSLNLCSSHGTVNHILFITGSLGSGLLFGYKMWMLYR